MSLSKNFPHQLALLVVALQTDKLPICEHLVDPTEKALVGTLMTYMNNRDFRTPITIARKTLGNLARIGRSTLFAKLKNLKEKGIIEDVIGDLPIRFTERAVGLMHTDWSVERDKPGKAKKEHQFFKIGGSSFPQEFTKLANRDVTDSQMRSLMSEAKKAKVKIQDVLNNFENIVKKYSGISLFLVLRDLVRNPAKYRPDAHQPPKEIITPGQRFILLTAQDNANCILKSDERVTHRDGRIAFHSASGDLPLSKAVAMVEERMRERVMTYVVAHGQLLVESAALGQRVAFTGDIDSDGRPLLTPQVDSRIITTWVRLYGLLPYADRVVDFAEPKDARIGQSFVARGVEYHLDSIDKSAGFAMLKVLTGKRAGQYRRQLLTDLDLPEVIWLEEWSGGSAVDNLMSFQVGL